MRWMSVAYVLRKMILFRYRHVWGPARPNWDAYKNSLGSAIVLLLDDEIPSLKHNNLYAQSKHVLLTSEPILVLCVTKSNR